MIYLICAQDSKKRITEVTNSDVLKTSFWDYVSKLTEHKNFLYCYSLYTKIFKQPLPNRVNVIFSLEEKKRKLPVITNAIICDNTKQILTSYKNTKEDVYILGDKLLIETFAPHADFLIIINSEDLNSTQQLIQDTINFADYNLLSSQDNDKYKISYFVRVPNFLRR